MFNDVVFIFGMLSDSSYDIGFTMREGDFIIPVVGDHVSIPTEHGVFTGHVYKRGIDYLKGSSASEPKVTVMVSQLMPDVYGNEKILKEEAKRKTALLDTES